jgi:multidrug efflux pump subunit AcrB
MRKVINYMTSKSQNTKMPRDKLLSKITLFLFDRPWATLAIWIVLVVFGAVSYLTLLKREGFPSISIPVAIVNGTYIVNDPAKVDAEVAKPISDLALKQDGVSTVQSQSTPNFFSVAIQYKDGTDAQASAKKLEELVKQNAQLPSNVNINYSVPYFGVTGGDSKKIDITISFYDPSGKADTAELAQRAQKAAEYLNQHKPALVETFFVQDPYQTAFNPATNQQQTIQKTFDRLGEREDNTTKFYNSVVIGVTAVNNADVIKLDDQIRSSLDQLHQQQEFKDSATNISASYAPSIKENISELQRVLLEGLIAVLVVGSIIIALRASIITVIAMITVILSTIGLLYLIGYSLNVITLFALILGLSLIVDDTIIMVEAIDAARRREKTAREAVRIAVRKISRAMVAATLTAALSFAPLLFVGGVLGSFIRAIPVTIISALLISLVVALVFIPLFARVLILGKKQMGERGVKEVAAGFEAKVAGFIGKPMLWAKGSQKKLLSVGLVAVLIGTLFIGAAGYVFTKVTFNIFPPTKDTNGLVLNMNFAPGTTIEQAEQIAAKADNLASSVIGSNFIQSSYYGMGSAQNASSYVEIISYSKRDVTSKQLVTELQQKFDSEFKDAAVTVGQMDVGPPSSSFVVAIKTDNRDAGFRLADDVAAYMKSAELTRPSGEKARFTNVSVSTPSQFTRDNGDLTIRVTAGFDGDDTTTLVTLGQNGVKKEFPESRVASYGINGNALNFDLGQESENQDSFKALLIAFPVLLGVIYLLLAVQFRSLLQPLLIFLAIPFSLLGVTLGLYLTDNPFSFFAALGFFALIGLSIKNTILLTDYANQSRRNGMGAIDSAVAALSERFRPLVATSLTAMVSLIPLAVTSPFWQGLAVVLIFGLLSSTFLVLTVFPYYYLGGEFLRMHISRRHFFTWLLVTVALVYGVMQIAPDLALLVVPVSLIAVGAHAFWRRKLRRA